MRIFKTSLAVLLAVLMAFSVVAVVNAADDATAEATYVVAGTENLCGTNWSATDENNKMTLADGLYTKVFKDVAVAEGYQFKVVENGEKWIGLEGDANVTFNVTEVCDVTITFNAATSEIKLDGKGVVVPTSLEIKSITAVGDPGDSTFLNGASWKQDDASNHMTEKDGVYTITYTDVKSGSYQFKFAANDSWNDSWGVKKADDTKEYAADAAVYNGDNIALVLEAVSNVTITLDLSKFDYATKDGATYKVDVQATGATEAPTEAEAAPVPGYYVVGSEEACGAEWGWEKPWLTSKPMKEAEDGTFFQIVENVKASAGNETDEGPDIYVFKVVYVDEKGGKTWHPGGMGNNTQVSVAQDGSTIVFKFKLLGTDPTVEGTDPEAVEATVYAPGEAVPEIKEKGAEPAPTEPETPVVAKKKANTLKVTAKKVTVKAKDVKKKAKAVKAITVKKAKGKVTYTKKSGKFAVNKTTGKITVKKGTKKGTYKVKVAVKAAGNADYKAATKNVTVTIKVK